MISVSSINFDPLGAIEFDEDQEDTNFGTKARRGNRIATLDGGAVTQDRGYTNSDLTFNIVAGEYSEIVFERLSFILENNPLVRLSCREGVFVGIIKDLSSKNKSFVFLVSGDG